MTQPAVSQHIRYLEELYGGRLLRYEKKQLTLTEAGRLLLMTARTLKSDDKSLRGRMRPVSYTHLDVYKRQKYGEASMM